GDLGRELDGGQVGVHDHARNQGPVLAGRRGLVGVVAAGVLQGEGVGDGLVGAVGEVDGVGAGEVGRVVELELAAVEAELGGVAEDATGVDEAGADLGGGRPEAVVDGAGGPVGPGDGAGGGGDAGDEAAGPLRVVLVGGAAAEAADPEGGDAGDVGGGHARAAEDAVAVGRVGAQDAGARGGDVGLEGEVKGAAPGRVAGGTAAAGVADADVVLGVDVEGGLDGAPGADGLDHGLAGGGFDEADEADAAGADGARVDVVVAVEEHELGAKGGGVVVLVGDGAAAEADEHDGLVQAGRVLGQGPAGVVLDRDVEGDGGDGPVDDGVREEAGAGDVGDAGLVGGAVAVEVGGEGLGGEHAGVGGGDGQDALAGGAAGHLEGAVLARVAGGEDDDDALVDDPRGHDGQGVLGEAAALSDAGADDVGARVKGLEEAFDDGLFVGVAGAAEHLERKQLGFGGDSDKPGVVIGFVSRFVFGDEQ
ncbi:hypothetical protein CTA1_6395, partial [Colletotrichum tanaceti]